MDVEAAPRVVVDQLPAMSPARRVLCQQHVTGTDLVRFTEPSLELEAPAQRHHVLSPRRIVPVERTTGDRLLELQLVSIVEFRERIRVVLRKKGDFRVLEVGLSILTLPGRRASMTIKTVLVG